MLERGLIDLLKVIDALDLLRRLGDHSRLGCEWREKLAFSRTCEEDEGPALEGSLVFRWWAGFICE